MEHAGKKQATITTVYLVLAAFFWAFPATLGKYVVDHVSPFFVTVFRLTYSLLVFLPFLLREKQRASLRGIDKRTWISLAISGGIFFGPHYVFYFLSVTFTYATHAGVLIQTGYLFLAIFCIVFLKESRSPRKIAGIVLSTAGIVMIVLANVDPSQDPAALPLPSILLGDAFMLVAMLLWAIYGTMNKKYLGKVGSLGSNFFNFLFGMLTVLPFSFGDFGSLGNMDVAAWVSLVLIATFGSLLGYACYNMGFSKMEGSRAAAILLLNPVFSVIISMLMLGESVTPMFLLGAAILIVSIGLVNTDQQKDKAC